MGAPDKTGPTHNQRRMGLFDAGVDHLGRQVTFHFAAGAVQKAYAVMVNHPLAGIRIRIARLIGLAYELVGPGQAGCPVDMIAGHRLGRIGFPGYHHLAAVSHSLEITDFEGRGGKPGGFLGDRVLVAVQDGIGQVPGKIGDPGSNGFPVGKLAFPGFHDVLLLDIHELEYRPDIRALLGNLSEKGKVDP